MARYDHIWYYNAYRIVKRGIKRNTLFYLERKSVYCLCYFLTFLKVELCFTFQIYPYLVVNDACMTESRREERILQLLRLLNLYLEKRKVQVMKF